MTRFNEAIDQALAESVARYEYLVRQSQNMFLAILGHDLRNPLGTIVSGARVIMQASDIPPKYVVLATRMFNSAKRMGSLVNDLIDFTRSHLGPGIPVHVKKGNLVAVCEQVVNELRVFHPGRVVDLQAPDRLDAAFDDARIAQVLSNLVGNAIQYGDPDTPVSIRLAGTDEVIILSVNNRGPVIPESAVSTIFNPLVRIAGENNARPSGQSNLGIGLFISQEIVRSHGGAISVISSELEGTTFMVTMPRPLK